MILYDNPVSPFARKVRLVLDYKGLTYEAVDGRLPESRDALAALNRRLEVPVLVHDRAVVANSPDIVAYLDRVFPERLVYPSSPGAWIRARAWERCSDTLIDPIMTNIAYWTFMARPDVRPAGMIEAARSDLAEIYRALEQELAENDFVCGELSIADLALFPHLAAVRRLDVAFDPDTFPRLLGWLKRMRSLDVCARDLERARRAIDDASRLGGSRRKIVWRGDRLEWLLAHGFHAWLLGEIQEGRAAWPGLGIPTPPAI